MRNKSVAIIGGGPAALSAAFFLSDKFHITIYEKEKTIGQKFLVAGKGGFNLTNALVGNELISKYTPINFLTECLLYFDSNQTIKWLKSLGVKTFIGTSGRVYAEKIHKPIDVLNKIKSALKTQKVNIWPNHNFIGFDKEKNPIIKNGNETETILADYYIFALGGASWSITGSDGKWINYFNSIGIETKEFEASNCGVNIDWDKNFISSHSGKPVKNIVISCGNINSTGEVVITDYGLEGNAIYSVVPEIREYFTKGNTDIFIDFKPNNTFYELISKVKGKEANSSNYKKYLNINSHQLALIKSQISKNDFQSHLKFVKLLKSLKLQVHSLRPIDEAISTVGGIFTDELNDDFSLKKFPNIFTIGEMVDWDAPTGGFLLQACFSMGAFTAHSILKRIT
jgi:uncharacterized flavoprotein (TIGR03862 family)